MNALDLDLFVWIVLPDARQMPIGPDDDVAQIA
jgi:hypothetical protein